MTTSKGNVATAVSVLSGITVGLGLFRDAKGKYDQMTLYTATVGDNAFVYSSLMTWLNDVTSPKAIKFVSKRDSLRKFYDENGAAKVNIGGHTLTVFLDRADLTKISESEYGAEDAIVFQSRHPEGIASLEKFLLELTEKRKREQREIYVYNPALYGWEARDFPFRELDSIILAEGVKEDLIDDLETFFGNEDRYARIGIPWHRGYLFHGPPGNGKSSLASSIAHRYRMSLYNLPLSGVKDDRALAENISRINDNSVLLLEDIDIFSKSIGRTQAESGPTLAGLLNALDGVSTPHGLMTFMTTNHIETLDPALIRPGRIDKRIELTAPTQHQVEQMFEYVYNEPLAVKPKKFPSMAELSNVFKKFTTDPESARIEIKGP